MRRNPLAVIFLTVFIDLLGFGILLPILPTYAVRMHATELAAALLSTTYSATQLLCAPLWGRLSDRVGRRPVLLATILGSLVTYVLFGLADAVWLLFLARALGGVMGANISTAQAYIADVTAPERRARGMAIIGVGFGLGFTLGPALAGVATHFGGERAPFFVAAGLSLVNLVWAWFALAEPERHGPPAGGASRLRSLGDALRTRTLAFWLAVFGLVTYAFANIEATFALFLRADLSFSDQQNAVVFTFIGLVLILVQAGGTRRLTARFGERALVVAGTALMAAGAGLVALTAHGWLILVPAGLIAAGNALSSPSLMASISKSAPPDRQGEVLGVAQSIGALGRIAGPAAGGLLFQRVGHTWPYLTTAGLMGIAALWVSARRARGTGPPTGR